MNHYRICVYAICKNEEKFADAWMDSMQEADAVVVLDTGSTDHTVEKLRARGAQVYQETISPWRFDAARNRSLELVPEDAEICVCVDLDERFEPGWREKLEAAWQPGTHQAEYRYTWNFNPDGSEGWVFWIDKIHARQGFQWQYPVHEVLRYTGPKPRRLVTAEGVQLNHYADPAKSRAQYLPLLELAVEEKPQDPRALHYLGREYFFRGEWDRCIDTLERYLALPDARWTEERCSSMRYIAQANLRKGQREEARRWYFRSIGEAPWLREPWLDLAALLSEEGDWPGVVYLTGTALRIQERPRGYFSEGYAWGSAPYDLAALGYYYTGDLPRALEMAETALHLSPEDERLKKNCALIREKLEQYISPSLQETGANLK